MEKSNPIVRRCRIRNGKQGGIQIFQNGAGIIEDCQIVDNIDVGMIIAQDSSPRVRNCKINGNGRVAISLLDSGAGSIDGCDLTGNAGGAWEAKGLNRIKRAGNIE
jgi:F-box protein 11